MDRLLGNGYMLHRVEDTVYKFNFLKKGTALSARDISEPLNFTVNSIALVTPNRNKLKNVVMGFDNLPIERLDFLCPTYTMLNKYKSDKDWDAYTDKYMKLIVQRKDQIKGWIDGLEAGHIYILCCWEDTSKASKCHRQIVHECFLNSKSAMSKMLPILKNGNCKEDICIDLPVPVEYMGIDPAYGSSISVASISQLEYPIEGGFITGTSDGGVSLVRTIDMGNGSSIAVAAEHAGNTMRGMNSMINSLVSAVDAQIAEGEDENS